MFLLCAALLLLTVSGVVLPDGWPSIVTFGLLFVGLGAVPFDARLERGSVSLLGIAAGLHHGQLGALPRRTVWAVRFATLLMLAPTIVLIVALPVPSEIDGLLWILIVLILGVIGFRSLVRRH